MWFEHLFGFPERDPAQVPANLELDGERIRSRVNGAEVGCGRLSTPSLAELRARVRPDGRPNTLREVVASVQDLHRDPAHAGALVQAASQFNLLEMATPTITPEAGVGIYEHDRTQGPACALACKGGVVYRNYFVPVDGGLGQTADRQIDCLAEVGEALGNEAGSLWSMRNGYAFLTPSGRQAIADHLTRADEPARDALRALLRVGLHEDLEVTMPGADHRVTQVYGSALPVGYGGGRASEWEPFARLVLEASYEATLLAAAENAAATGNPTVLLTLLGGGVFGNETSWILDAIARASAAVPAGLDLVVVSYRSSTPGVRALAARLDSGARVP